MYERVNSAQSGAERDHFTAGRYRQFARYSPPAGTALDVGCGTGQGGAEYARRRPRVDLWGLDVVRERVERLPDVYRRRIRADCTAIPVPDQSVDVVLAGEVLEHLLPRDVDPALWEFHRVLRVGGRLLLTTPNPRYLRLAMAGGSVYSPVHLTQHYAPLLRSRLMTHGFGKVRIRGSGRATRYAGERFPLLAIYGSYLISADKR